MSPATAPCECGFGIGAVPVCQTSPDSVPARLKPAGGALVGPRSIYPLGTAVAVVCLLPSGNTTPLPEPEMVTLPLTVWLAAKLFEAPTCA